MAVSRYAMIKHENDQKIIVRFPSTAARNRFQREFEAYHASHDHDGAAPVFLKLSAVEANKRYQRAPENLFWEEDTEQYRMTLDGYTGREIQEYHEREFPNADCHYQVPTCCVAPIIAPEGEFMASGDLPRHELSAIFGDMPAWDYESLLASVARDGFIDNIIKLLDGKVLDGWHRYRAAQALNLVRKLRFQNWDAERDGDPKAFVLARNIERRHLSASQRAQIAVSFNERFGHGGDRKSEASRHQKGDLKTRQELAAAAKVGRSTIDRAVAVEKAGGAEKVISGEKTAAEVLGARTADRESQIANSEPLTAETVELGAIDASQGASAQPGSMSEEWLFLEAGGVEEVEVSEAERFDWGGVGRGFDPEKHEWLRVTIQRGADCPPGTERGRGVLSYGATETAVVVEKGVFSVAELTAFAAKLSEILAKWVATKD